MNTQKPSDNVIAGLSVVKTSIVDLNRVSAIKGELKILKDESKHKLAHLFQALSDIDLNIEGLEQLNNTQKRTLVLNEIAINLEDEYAIKIFSFVQWYYGSKLSLKKEFVSLANIKTLKKLRKYYLKGDIKRIFEDKTIVTSAEYTKQLTAVLDKATILATAMSNAKSKDTPSLSAHTEKNGDIKGLIIEGGKIEYDIATVDYIAVSSYNHACNMFIMQTKLDNA